MFSGAYTPLRKTDQILFRRKRRNYTMFFDKLTRKQHGCAASLLLSCCYVSRYLVSHEPRRKWTVNTTARKPQSAAMAYHTDMMPRWNWPLR